MSGMGQGERGACNGTERIKVTTVLLIRARWLVQEDNYFIPVTSFRMHHRLQEYREGGKHLNSTRFLLWFSNYACVVTLSRAQAIQMKSVKDTAHSTETTKQFWCWRVMLSKLLRFTWLLLRSRLISWGIVMADLVCPIDFMLRTKGMNVECTEIQGKEFYASHFQIITCSAGLPLSRFSNCGECSRTNELNILFF